MAAAFAPGGHDATAAARTRPRLAGGAAVCGNIKLLYNLDPPVTDEEIRASASQYVRKISGFGKPSASNREAFDQAVEEVAAASRRLLGSLTTQTPAHKRELEASRAHIEDVASFGSGE
jgi:hypothetical protein